MSDAMTDHAHPKCDNGHVCQEPSGRTCVEVECNEAAGTLWGPLWCPDHDRERLDRISASFAAIIGGAPEPLGEVT